MMTQNPMRSIFPTTEEDHLKTSVSGNLKALDGQSINTGPLRYTFTERQLIGDAKATFTQAALDIGIRKADNFNKVLLEMNNMHFQHMLSANKRGTCVGT